MEATADTSPTIGAHELEEHTGEIALAIRASTLADLFAEAARALAEVMLDEVDRGRPPDGPVERVEVQSSDAAALLIDWLNELIFLADTKRSVFSQVSMRRVSDRELVAEARGIREPALKTAVKAATLHDATVVADDSGFRARVVLDV